MSFSGTDRIRDSEAGQETGDSTNGVRALIRSEAQKTSPGIHSSPMTSFSLTIEPFSHAGGPAKDKNIVRGRLTATYLPPTFLQGEE